MNDPSGHAVALSVVVPCYNEEESLPALVKVLGEVLPGVAETFEVILVDDGSRDGTLEMLREVNAGDPRFRYLALSRNFGKEAAMLAGLQPGPRRRGGDHGRRPAAPAGAARRRWSRCSRGLRPGGGPPRPRRRRPGLPHVRLPALLPDDQRPDRRRARGRRRRLPGAQPRGALDALLSLGETNRFSKGLFAWIGFRTAVRRLPQRLPRGRRPPSGACATCSTTASTA